MKFTTRRLVIVLFSLFYLFFVVPALYNSDIHSIFCRLAFGDPLLPQSVDPEDLPDHSLFAGPWDKYIKAPAHKSHITPSRVWQWDGSSRVRYGSGRYVVPRTRAGDGRLGDSIDLVTGGTVTVEFAENVGGRVCLQLGDVKGDPEISLGYSESYLYVGIESDATTERRANDLPLTLKVRDSQSGKVACVDPQFNRGGFKYLTVHLPPPSDPGDDAPSPSLVPGSAPPGSVRDAALAGWQWAWRWLQAFVGPGRHQDGGAPDRAISLRRIWVNCTAFPSQDNGRAYTGYFHSSSVLLNRIWYAGAYTLQLSTIDPREGSALIDRNRQYAGLARGPAGEWYSNFTIAPGRVAVTDGAKRDRVVWPGDLMMAAPGIAVTTHDMAAVRNALDALYLTQAGNGELPWAGPPVGLLSDTYHLYTLLATWEYVTYSGDVDWFAGKWGAFATALQASIAKIDSTGLLRVTHASDWLRPGMYGHNLEANAILHAALGRGLQLAAMLGRVPPGDWLGTQEALANAVGQLYCPRTGLYSDNMGSRGCGEAEQVDPQDGNSWLLASRMLRYDDMRAVGRNVSGNLRARWTAHGAPSAEMPGVISPFVSGIELLAHCAAGRHDDAVELMLLEWGYLLDGPGFTNSTLAEGFRVDGGHHYVAYPHPSRGSQCHAWSTGPTAVLTTEILGIRLRAPAGREWTVAPRLTRWLGWASGGFATTLGKFEVRIMRVVERRDGGGGGGDGGDGTPARRAQLIQVWAPPGTAGELDLGMRTPVPLKGGDPTTWVVWESGRAEQLVSGSAFASFPPRHDLTGKWPPRRVRYDGDVSLVYDDAFAPPEMEPRMPGVYES